MLGRSEDAAEVFGVGFVGKGSTAVEGGEVEEVQRWLAVETLLFEWVIEGSGSRAVDAKIID